MPDYKFTVGVEGDEDKLWGRDSGKGILSKILKNAKISLANLSNCAKVFVPR
jgi:hypothetical protein